MSNESIPIGIDFGHSYSSVAYWDVKSGEGKYIPNANGENSTPSVVAFTETECLIGTAALNQASENPENTIFNVKRILGKTNDDDEVFLLNLKSAVKFEEGKDERTVICTHFKGKAMKFTPEEIVALLLR